MVLDLYDAIVNHEFELRVALNRELEQNFLEWKILKHLPGYRNAQHLALMDEVDTTLELLDFAYQFDSYAPRRDEVEYVLVSTKTDSPFRLTDHIYQRVIHYWKLSIQEGNISDYDLAVRVSYLDADTYREKMQRIDETGRIQVNMAQDRALNTSALALPGWIFAGWTQSQVAQARKSVLEQSIERIFPKGLSLR